MFFFAPGPCPSTAELQLSSLFLLTRPCGPRFLPHLCPFSESGPPPRLPLGLQDGAQPGSRTPGKDRLPWPRPLTLTASGTPALTLQKSAARES